MRVLILKKPPAMNFVTRSALIAAEGPVILLDAFIGDPPDWWGVRRTGDRDHEPCPVTLGTCERMHALANFPLPKKEGTAI